MFLITGGYSHSNAGDLEQLKPKFLEHEIGFNLIGVNFFEAGDEEGGQDVPDERIVPAVKKVNERLLREFVRGVDGAFHDIQEGLALLSLFRTRTVKQVPTFTGNLSIG